MKDATHHLKNIQKKVVQENRRTLEREGRYIVNNHEMDRGIPLNGNSFSKSKKQEKWAG